MVCSTHAKRSTAFPECCDTHRPSPHIRSLSNPQCCPALLINSLPGRSRPRIVRRPVEPPCEASRGRCASLRRVAATPNPCRDRPGRPASAAGRRHRAALGGAAGARRRGAGGARRGCPAGCAGGQRVAGRAAHLWRRCGSGLGGHLDPHQAAPAGGQCAVWPPRICRCRISCAGTPVWWGESHR
jgi:hypothetical protein